MSRESEGESPAKGKHYSAMKSIARNKNVYQRSYKIIEKYTYIYISLSLSLALSLSELRSSALKSRITASEENPGQLLVFLILYVCSECL